MYSETPSAHTDSVFYISEDLQNDQDDTSLLPKLRSCYYCPPQNDFPTIVCSYCDHQIYLHNEAYESRRAGYEYEQGRIKAREDHQINHSLANKIKEYLDLQEQAETLRVSVSSTQNEISKEEAAYKAKSAFSNKILPYLIAFQIIVFAYFFAVITGSVLLIFLIAFMIAFLVCFLYNKHLDHILQGLEDHLSVLSITLATQVKDLSDIESQMSRTLVPPHYRTREACEYFYRTISSGLALTLPQAIAQYETHLSEEEKTQLLLQQMERQQQQLDLRERELDVQKKNRKKPLISSEAAAVIGTVAIGALVKGLGKKH